MDIDTSTNMPGDEAANVSRTVAAWRIGWTVVSFLAVETLVCAAAALPSIAIAVLIMRATPDSLGLRSVVLSVAIVPLYVLFALLLMAASAAGTRLTGWRTRPGLEMRIALLEWPLMDWVRYMGSIHLVRVLAGTLLRGTPVWTAYLRLHGARFGRRVYVNSLALSDYTMLTCGDDVVIGEDVHLSGHTVERGTVKTGHVTIGSGVTIGLGTFVDIDVVIGDGCQVGAMSLVPKHARLEPDGVYTGVPARRLTDQAEPPYAPGRSARELT